MTRTGYQALGLVVWEGGKWYARRRIGRYLPPRPALIAGATAVGIGVALAAGKRASASS
jgi:hypothetical protein